MVGALVLFWGTAQSIVAIWYRSGTFSHGFLILPISLYLVWLCRRRLALLQPMPSRAGLLLLGILGFGWLLGDLTSVLVVQQLALVAMLPALVWAVLGTSVARGLLVPLAFLFFAVPMGESVVPPLQDFTAFFTVRALDLSGIPVILEGRYLSVPSGRWEVSEACSGVRYVIPSVALGYLFAFAIYRSWSRRLFFLLASVGVPILANGIRAYGIVMLAYLTKNRIAVGVDHLIYGWLFFGVVVAFLFWLGLRWRESDELSSGGVGVLVQSSSAEPAHPMVDTPARPYPAWRVILTAVGGILILGLAPVSARMMASAAGVPAVIPTVALSVTPPWIALPEYTGNWEARFLGADVESARSYASGERRVHVYVAYYSSQRQGKELINSQNALVDGKQWVWLGESRRQAMVDGGPLSVHETRMRSADGIRLIWSWYWVADEYTASPYRAKLLQAKARLLGGPQGAAAVAVATDSDGYSTEAAAEALQDFLRHTSVAEALRGNSN